LRQREAPVQRRFIAIIGRAAAINSMKSSNIFRPIRDSIQFIARRSNRDRSEIKIAENSQEGVAFSGKVPAASSRVARRTQSPSASLESIATRRRSRWHLRIGGTSRNRYSASWRKARH